jgi:hypothetical protein
MRLLIAVHRLHDVVPPTRVAPVLTPGTDKANALGRVYPAGREKARR